jgi:hypothetical protein
VALWLSDAIDNSLYKFSLSFVGQQGVSECARIEHVCIELENHRQIGSALQ